MTKIGLPKGSGKWLKVREKSVKSQGILKWILSGNPENIFGIMTKMTATPIYGKNHLKIFFSRTRRPMT